MAGCIVSGRISCLCQHYSGVNWTLLILATEAPVFKGKNFTRKVHRITERKDFVLYVRKKHVFTSLFNERIKKKKRKKKRKG